MRAAVAILALSVLAIGAPAAFAGEPETMSDNRVEHRPVNGVRQGGETIGSDAHSAAKAVGHGTRDATRAVGHGVRDTTKAIGHGTRDFFRGIGTGLRDGWHEATE
jgi:hypothetical protein